MTNLLNDVEGRNASLVAQRFLLQRRLSRFFKRNLVIDYNQWSVGSGDFDLATLLGDLNDGHDDEIRDLYRLLGTIGGLSESIADTTVYVNATTGSDVNGTGSATRPYASLWFLSLLPTRINHVYRIAITGTIAQTEDLVIANTFGENGCLSFIGVGAATEMYPALAGTIAGIASAFGMMNFQTSVIPSQPVDYTFVQFTTGAKTGWATPVDRINLAADPIAAPFNGLTTRLSTWLPGNGDGYRYIQPAATIDFDTEVSLSIVGRGENTIYNSAESQGARIVFANLNLDFDTGSSLRKLLIDSQVETGLYFVKVDMPPGNGENIEIRSSVNRHRPVDIDIETVAQSGVVNIINGAPGNSPSQCGALVCNEYVWGSNPIIQLAGDADVWAIDCIGKWKVKRATALIAYSAAMALIVNSSKLETYQISVLGDYNPADYVIHAANSEIQLYNAFIGFANIGIECEHSRILSLWAGNDGNLGANQYIFDLSGVSHVASNAVWGAAGGAVADIQFSNTAPTTTAAFPAGGAAVTDAHGQVYSQHV
jgi:hypothetical protein